VLSIAWCVIRPCIQYTAGAASMAGACSYTGRGHINQLRGLYGHKPHVVYMDPVNMTFDINVDAKSETGHEWKDSVQRGQ